MKTHNNALTDLALNMYIVHGPVSEVLLKEIKETIKSINTNGTHSKNKSKLGQPRVSDLNYRHVRNKNV